MAKIPDFIQSYVEFVNFRKYAMENGHIDLTGISFLNSTTVMLLAFLKHKYHYEIKSTDSSRAGGYLSVMTQNPKWWLEGKNSVSRIYSGTSYVPFSQLPTEDPEFKILLSKIYQLIKSYETLGGQNAFKYVQTELSDNIYQHSKFKNAYMMCQAYTTKGYIELSFVDDGISIPGNFEAHEISFKSDSLAIKMASEGVSTKDPVERGTGLGSSLNIYCQGAEAEALIASRNGAYYQKSDHKSLFSLDKTQSFCGTLVSIRIPMAVNEIEIEKYLE